MLSKRIIPCLDVDAGEVVKGTNFVEMRYAGDPVELASLYYQQGADEICFLDITASHEERKATYKVIEETAKQVFVPLTVGGGVSSTDDVARLLQAGADKVAMNTAAVRDPKLIERSANSFGSQCIVVAVDVKRVGKSWHVFIRGGREDTGIDAIEWIVQACELGAGEILLTSMDADGTKAGYDLEVTQRASELINIPVIASGGAGNCEHIIDVFKTGADAALLASILHYKELTIAEIKAAMAEAKVPVRST